jgi:peptide/nickel transport system ATP-binding protein
MALLEVENLSIGYHTQKGYLHAVEDVSFSLEEGKSLGFVGESGCGKTTLGMALMRLLPPNGVIREGRMLFDGADLLQKSNQVAENSHDLSGRHERPEPGPPRSRTDCRGHTYA